MLTKEGQKSGLVSVDQHHQNGNGDKTNGSLALLKK
jgi:hypothetical protein